MKLTLRTEKGRTWLVEAEDESLLQNLMLDSLKKEFENTQDESERDLLDSAIVLMENGIKYSNWMQDKNNALCKYDLTHGKFQLEYIEIKVVEEEENVIP